MHIWQHVTESAYREILRYEQQITITKYNNKYNGISILSIATVH